MAAISQADANAILNATLGTASYTSSTGSHLRLGTNAPSATVAMTELSATGYTPGGIAVTFSSASAGATSNSTAPSFTNSSGGSLSIVGAEIWDVAGTPVRHWFASWTSQPISVPNLSTFAVASGALAIALS